MCIVNSDMVVFSSAFVIVNCDQLKLASGV
jgi:hypothetical protein